MPCNKQHEAMLIFIDTNNQMEPYETEYMVVNELKKTRQIQQVAVPAGKYEWWMKMKIPDRELWDIKVLTLPLT
jgi:hypothetical protein